MTDKLPPPPPSSSSSSKSAANATASPPPAPVQAIPKARQIVSINEEGTNFQLDEQALEEIFAKVPSDMKVAIFSVVGAFRTGKSFVLDLFLRYLRHGVTDRLLSDTGAPEDPSDTEWKQWVYHGVVNDDDSTLEGNANIEETYGEKGFSWRAGRKRNTTGIWMWETPFIRPSAIGESIAIFLLDTQGMFDSETSQMLTASIFGLSTLLSSYQIYNIDKRVQEDNLQHLALFTEYGRMALMGNHDGSSMMLPAVQQKNPLSKHSKDEDKEEEESDSFPRPFQRLDFLVRDWQDFSRKQTIASKRADMKQYMKELLSARTQKDLADTREQITSCFERVDCFLLPHPGHEVTEREYDGNVAAIDIRFLELLTVYLDTLFTPSNVVAKTIHGIPVTSRELLTYIKAYAALFREATIFPEAKTLLEATAEANNVNMKERALLAYKKEMNTMVGLKCKYVSPSVLQAHHQVCMESAMTVFDTGAKMGRRSQILLFRERLSMEIEIEMVRYIEFNAERDPYKNLALYLVPGIVALCLLLFRIAQDLFCYEHIGYDLPLYDCKHVSKTLTHLYWAIIVFMLLITFSTGQVMMKRIKTVWSLIQTAIQDNSSTKQKAD